MVQQNLKKISMIFEIMESKLVNITEENGLYWFEVVLSLTTAQFFEERDEIQNEVGKVFISVKGLRFEAKEELENTKEKKQSFFETIFYGQDPSRLNEKIKMLQVIVEKLGNLENKIHKEIIKLSYAVRKIHDKIDEIQHQIDQKRQQLHKGLTPERIQEFQHFQADEQLAGERCAVCLDDVIVGRSMVRLDCEGRHVFCQHCVECWLADQNTCPTCRHVFA